MLNVNSKTKIYVLCPPSLVTGGPELLHQLVHWLRELGHNSYIFYTQDIENPTPDAYKEYNIEIASMIEDDKNNILVMPETYIEYFKMYKNIKRALWWLSVDLYYMRVNDIKKSGGKDLYRNNNPLKDKSLCHIVQSEYAYQHLTFLGITDILRISDYINDRFLNEKVKYDSSERENVVFYNPSKGLEFTKKIMYREPNIKYIPIVNLEIEEIVKLLNKGKVYIDFGFHPGKDRIPREAAISGCCVITGRQGSARYFEDIPINDTYKFSDSEKEIDKIISKIKDCFNNYNDRIKDSEFYREKIRHEKENFIRDIQETFVRDE